MMSLDGHFFIDSSSLEMGRGWLTFADAEEETSPQLFTEGITIAKQPTKRKSLFGIKLSSEVNLAGQCKLIGS